jgi:hypothetical protein
VEISVTVPETDCRRLGEYGIYIRIDAGVCIVLIPDRRKIAWRAERKKK